MARNPCGCVGTECSCKIVSTDGSILVGGKGTAAQPYDLSNDQGHFEVVDSPTIDLTKSGDGSSMNPYTIGASLTASIRDLSDVDDGASPAAGQVLAWDGTVYKPTPPVTAAPGAINHDASLKGDGSAATPLASNLNPNGLLEVTGNGIGLSQATIAAINRAIRPIPAPHRVLRDAGAGFQDSFPSGFWIGILSFNGPYPAGWYDISGKIGLHLYNAGGPMQRGCIGFSRIVAGSAGGPGVVTNQTNPVAPFGLEGEGTDLWSGATLDWGLKGTYHHTGGDLRFALDTYALDPGLSCGVSNPHTYLVLSCISLD